MQQSLLIIAKNRDKSIAYVSELLKKEGIDLLDISNQTFEKAMGIEDVRNIQKAILLKPFRGKAKAVIINTHEGITIEAQNALLKIFEEPPANTILIIISSKKELILPTILSRCKIITLREEEIKLFENEILKFNETLDTLLNGSAGDKLKIAQEIAKDKEEAILWLEKMAIFIKNKVEKSPGDIKYFNFLKSLQYAYKTIKSTNVGARVTLENFFLSF